MGFKFAVSFFCFWKIHISWGGDWFRGFYCQKKQHRGDSFFSRISDVENFAGINFRGHIFYTISWNYEYCYIKSNDFNSVLFYFDSPCVYLAFILILSLVHIDEIAGDFKHFRRRFRFLQNSPAKVDVGVNQNFRRRFQIYSHSPHFRRRIQLSPISNFLDIFASKSPGSKTPNRMLCF